MLMCRLLKAPSQEECLYPILSIQATLCAGVCLMLEDIAATVGLRTLLTSPFQNFFKDIPMSNTITIYHFCDLRVGDYATFYVTGTDIKTTSFSGFVYAIKDKWRIGVSAIASGDPEGPPRTLLPTITLVEATREVPLPTKLWSVITDIEVASGFPYERGILIPNCNLPEGEPVWLLVDEEGHYSVYYSASLKYFSVPESEILS